MSSGRRPEMAIHLARGLLRRYPALRSTWPVQQASAWRERQSRRARPRRMASWYRDATDMRTRLFMSNLELPEAPHLCEPTTVLLTLMDEELVWLGFKDPSFALPTVIENLFPHRVSLLGTARDRLRHLVTQKESRKFGREFNPWHLYKY